MAKQKMESKFYRIFELQQELKNGKEQYEKMAPSYRKFIEELKKIENPDELVTDAIKQFESDADSIDKGLENIKRRLWAIELLLQKSDESDEAKEIVNWFVTLVFTALGIDLTADSTSDD